MSEKRKELTFSELIERLKEHNGREPDKALIYIQQLEQRYRRACKLVLTATEQTTGMCVTCAFVKDCAKHDNNDMGPSTWYWGDCDGWKWNHADDREEDCEEQPLRRWEPGSEERAVRDMLQKIVDIGGKNRHDLIRDVLEDELVEAMLLLERLEQISEPEGSNSEVPI